MCGIFSTHTRNKECHSYFLIYRLIIFYSSSRKVIVPVLEIKYYLHDSTMLNFSLMKNCTYLTEYRILVCVTDTMFHSTDNILVLVA